MSDNSNSPVVEEIEAVTAPQTIRRRRHPRRRVWGSFARFFLRWLFRWANG